MQFNKLQLLALAGAATAAAPWSVDLATLVGISTVITQETTLYTSINDELYTIVVNSPTGEAPTSNATSTTVASASSTAGLNSTTTIVNSTTSANDSSSITSGSSSGSTSIESDSESDSSSKSTKTKSKASSSSSSGLGAKVVAPAALGGILSFLYLL